LGYRMVKIS